ERARERRRVARSPAIDPGGGIARRPGGRRQSDRLADELEAIEVGRQAGRRDRRLIRSGALVAAAERHREQAGCQGAFHLWPLTTTGVGWSVVAPLPSCPSSPRPQQ